MLVNKVICLLLQWHLHPAQKMSGSNKEDLKEQELTNNASENKVGGDISEEDLKALDKTDESVVPASEKQDENPMPSPQREVLVLLLLYVGYPV